MKSIRILKMNSNVVLAALTLVGLSAFTTTGGGSGQTPDGAWTIASRTLPLPAAASDVLRAAIANTPQPDVAEHIRQTTFTTKEAWVEPIRALDAGNALEVEAQIERLKVTIKEEKIAGVTVRMVTPVDIDPANENRLFVHTHGGAYVLGSGRAGLREAILIAHLAKIPVLSIDYRMPPEHPFPAAIEDVVAVWRSLLSDRPANSMALGGTSAGGGLTLASTYRFIQLGLETPGALWAGTPWADLTKTGDSFFINEGIDRNLVTYDGLLEGAANLYADGRDLKTPLISPVYGDFTDFPPTYLVTGTRILVRVFAGWDFEPAEVQRSHFADQGYARGVPMGGELTDAPQGAAPAFMVRALRDVDGANLDRIQIVKGWLDAEGETHEKVFDVALSDGRRPDPRTGKAPSVGNTVDVANATWSNTIGSPLLACYWKDPEFDANQSAFYYVRVIEIPTPRWTAYDAKRFGITLPSEVPMTVTERAYTSPIWYTPAEK